MPITSISWRNPESLEKSDHLSLLGCSSDGWIMNWNPDISKLNHRFLLEGQHALICEYSMSGSLFAVGCGDFSIKIYNSDSYELKYTLFEQKFETLGHTNHIFALKWINDRILCSGGWDRVVFMWDIKSR